MLSKFRQTLTYKYALKAGYLFLAMAIFFGIVMGISTIGYLPSNAGLLPISILIIGSIITAVSSVIWYTIIIIDTIRHKTFNPQTPNNDCNKNKLIVVIEDITVVIYILISIFVLYVILQDLAVRMR